MKKHIIRILLGVAVATMLGACSKPSDVAGDSARHDEDFNIEWGDSANNGFFD